MKAFIVANPLNQSNVPETIGEAEVQLQVLDTNGPSLNLQLAATVISTGSNTLATLTRNTPATNILTVALSAAPTNVISFPPTGDFALGQTSVTFTSKPGIQVSQFGTPAGGGALAANYTVANAVVAPSLGRNLSGNAPNVTVNLIEPHTLLGDRVNEMDIRVGKILRFGGSRVNVGLDVYNLLNSAAVLSYNQAFIPNGRWLTPTSVMTARFAKVSAQIDF